MFCGESLESNGGMTQLTWPTSNADILHMKLCNIPGSAATDIKAYQNSKHIKTYSHNTSQYVLLDQRRQPLTIQDPATQNNICFIASPMPKNTPFYPPQSGVFKKPTMTLWVVQFMTLQQPIKEALKMT